jgi:hypothetical protein
MDISVSRLNNRLALQLPVELPLGLVFVVGHIDNLETVNEGDRGTRIICFDLLEKNHRIVCKLSARAATETKLSQGTKVRAGGHLVFDCHSANYYLLARDVEVVSNSEELSNLFDDVEINGDGSSTLLGRQALTPILADIKRRAEATNLEEANLPYWVQRLAPPEIKAELVQTESVMMPTAESAPTSLLKDGSLIDMLSQAMDSDEEVELTPEMVAKFLPANKAIPLPPTLAASQAQTAVLESTSTQQSLMLPLFLLASAVLLLAVLLMFLL